MGRLEAAIVAAVFGTSAALGAATAEPVTESVAEQLEALTNARELASSAAADGSATPARMDQVRDATHRPVRIRLGPNAVELAPDPDLAELDGAEARDFRLAVDRLTLLVEELRAADDVVSFDPATLEAAVSDAYREVRARPTLAQRAWRFAEDLLVRVVEALAGASDDLGIAAAIVLGLLSAVGLWVVGRRLLLVADEHVPPSRGVGQRPADWRRAAEAALAAGDLDGAVRAQYRLLIHQLARRGLIRDTPSLTPAEARRAVAGAPRGLDDAVREATAVFERMAYGQVPPEPDDVDRMRSAVEAAAP